MAHFFACCHFFFISFSFPFHSSHYRTYGVNCILVLQGCLYLRTDVDSKSRADIVARFVAFLQQKQREKEKGSAAAAASDVRKRTRSSREDNNAECCIC